MIAVANAPCSWGVLEFESTAADQPGPAQVLNEIAATGYAGTELGDWGFFPTEPSRLRTELDARTLALVGAFVPVALSEPSAHSEGEARAVRTAALMRDAAFGDTPPLVVLADAPIASHARSARAGRIAPGDALPPERWPALAAGCERIARAVRDATGLRTVFHHHCATYVETPGEIETLVARTAPDLVGLCLDTGHATYAGGDPLALLRRHRPRVWHVHFKDCSPEVAATAREREWDYITALRNGLFCELGRGSVDFSAIARELRDTAYEGWIVVEQDVLPSMGTPAESAARNRRFLASLGL